MGILGFVDLYPSLTWLGANLSLYYNNNKIIPFERKGFKKVREVVHDLMTGSKKIWVMKTEISPMIIEALEIMERRMEDRIPGRIFPRDLPPQNKRHTAKATVNQATSCFGDVFIDQNTHDESLDVRNVKQLF